MQKLPIYQVDAFTDKLFAGNPAAVVPLEEWLSEEQMQAIAAENNLSETAFFVKNGKEYDLRWFTPAMEVIFCGHATLATAHILFSELGQNGSLVFNTRVGKLIVKEIAKNTYLMDFPVDKLSPIAISQELESAVGIPASETFAGREDIIYVVSTQKMVEQVTPNFKTLGAASERGVLVTAPGENCDFVSRCFFPNAGIDEDPVTGSAHTTLVPYWAKRLLKTKLIARQISERGGYLECELAENGEKVLLTGNGVTYMRGEIFIG